MMTPCNTRCRQTDIVIPIESRATDDSAESVLLIRRLSAQRSKKATCPLKAMRCDVMQHV